MSVTDRDLMTTLRTTVSRYGLFAHGQTVVVGVSGGPDSTALLHALASLRAEWGLKLVAGHLNHCFRGAESDGDADYVRALCERLAIPCRIETADVPALQKRRHLSAQEAARTVRHAFLRQVAAEAGMARIALAHTRDDRTESVLLNIVRGSGLEGLAGFPPLALPLVRPLYDTYRTQVEAYCSLHALDPRQDSSNAKRVYRRNRVRLELLPRLRADFNPNVDAALLRLADLAREDSALLDTLAADALERIRSGDREPAGRLVLPLATLNELPMALRRRVLRQAIRHVRGHLQDVDFEMIERCLTAAATADAYGIELPAGESETVRLRCDERQIEIRKAETAASALSWQMILNVPGRTPIPQAGVAIEIRCCLPAELPDIVASWNAQAREEEIAGGRIGNHTGASGSEAGSLAIWSRAAVVLPLIARSWQSGDRMRPRGLGGSKKLQDIFTDAKIPPPRRRQIPLLVEAGGEGRILAAGARHLEESALFAAALPVDVASLIEWTEKNFDKNINQELMLIRWEYE